MNLLNLFSFNIALIFFASDLSALQASFDHGKQIAESKKGDAGGIDVGSIPQYQSGYQINKDELSNSFAHLESSEEGKALREVHNTRKPYILDDTEDFMVRSESIHGNPEKAFEEVEAVEGGSDSYTIETCDECPNEEYFVKARKTKKRYVYLQTPPYITAGQNCKNHGYLTIKVEIVSEPEEIFREDGLFNDIRHISTQAWGGAYIDETYSVNGASIVLRKTIQQNGSPWIRPDCYLVPALQSHVVSAATMISKLLGGSEDESIYWGEIGYAYLHHRVVNDTGEHYWILDDACQHYEELTREDLCRYHSMEEDPPSDKYWKGKKVNGSWGQTVTYACKSSCKDTCAELKARGCSREADPECLESKDGKCLRWKWKFRCKDRVAVAKHKFSKKNPFCLGGDCIDSSYESDRDMIQALGYLSILEEARKELDGTANVQVFKGQSHACTRFPLSFKDCCNCGGWGVSLGVTGCDEDSKAVGQLRNQGKCVRVGTYCAEYVNVGLAKFCLREKTSFCCFGTKFAKLLQEQGRPQIGRPFGDPKCPDCGGFTPEELSRLDFSKLDLTEIANDVMSRFKPKSGEHFAKAGELDRIREQMELRQQGEIEPSAETKQRVLDVSSMEMPQRRAAITEVIQQASSKNLLPEERQKLQAYLDATAPIALPNYVIGWTLTDAHTGGPIIEGRYVARYTSTPDNPTALKYYDSPPWSSVVSYGVIPWADQQNREAGATNTELKREYLQRIETQKSIPVPVDELTKIVSSMEVSSKPVEDCVLHRAQQQSGGVNSQYLQENMRHLTGSLKPHTGGK